VPARAHSVLPFRHFGFVFVVSACLLPGCRRSASNTSFAGVWTRTIQNGLTNGIQRETLTVTAAQDRFRIVTTNDTLIKMEVFDGKELHTQYLYLHEPTEDDEDTLPDQTPVSTRRVTASEAARLAFWSEAPAGDAAAGEAVAGRATLLYATGLRREDGETKVEAWVDRRTGVLLKKTETVLSRKVRRPLVRTVLQCLQISYGAVKGTAFRKPSGLITP
jgi:hypothetical protein